MALDLALDLHGSGVEARYWRITQTHLDHLQGQATVWLHGWRDEAARQHGRAPAAGFSLTLLASELNASLHDLSTGALYAALKARAIAAPDTLQPAAAPIGPSILAGAADC
jgi:O-succinylbenzoate synthase